MANQQPLLLKRREVAKRLGISPSTLDRKWAAGKFPSPRKIPGGTIAWRTDEVEEWVKNLEPVKAGE